MENQEQNLYCGVCGTDFKVSSPPRFTQLLKDTYDRIPKEKRNFTLDFSQPGREHICDRCHGLMTAEIGSKLKR